ncbi:MAG: hypothetical protein KBD60_13605 [Sterolibacterium sp.]|jgi:hypothetical protein|nr:hypothetical protein [Sterolibacterium sp.]
MLADFVMADTASASHGTETCTVTGFAGFFAVCVWNYRFHEKSSDAASRVAWMAGGDATDAAAR